MESTTKQNLELLKGADLPLEMKSLSDIQIIILQSWPKVNFGAKPYLDAMGAIDPMTGKYYEDTWQTIVSYFLCNASTWKGEIAKSIKAELKRRLKKNKA